MEKNNKKQEDRGNNRKVIVTVDGVEHKIERGTYIVKELKRVLGVEPHRELLEIKGKKMKPLADDEKTNVEGGEIFVTHVCTGASS